MYFMAVFNVTMTANKASDLTPIVKRQYILGMSHAPPSL